MKKYLVVICEKVTKNMVGDIHLVEAESPYECVNIIEKLEGFRVDGNETYIDYVEIREEDLL